MEPSRGVQTRVLCGGSAGVPWRLLGRGSGKGAVYGAGAGRFFLAPSPPYLIPSAHLQHMGRKNRAVDRNQGLGLNLVTTAVWPDLL